MESQTIGPRILIIASPIAITLLIIFVLARFLTDINENYLFIGLIACLTFSGILIGVIISFNARLNKWVRNENK